MTLEKSIPNMHHILLLLNHFNSQLRENIRNARKNLFFDLEKLNDFYLSTSRRIFLITKGSSLYVSHCETKSRRFSHSEASNSAFHRIHYLNKIIILVGQIRSREDHIVIEKMNRQQIVIGLKRVSYSCE